MTIGHKEQILVIQFLRSCFGCGFFTLTDFSNFGSQGLGSFLTDIPTAIKAAVSAGMMRFNIFFAVSASTDSRFSKGKMRSSAFSRRASVSFSRGTHG